MIFTRPQLKLALAPISLFLILNIVGVGFLAAEESASGQIASTGDALSAAPTVAPTITPTPLPQSGSLAGTWSSTMGGQVAPEVWGGIEIGAKSDVPITGSIYRAGSGWIAKIFNNSTDTYSVSASVEQLNSRGGRTRSDFISVMVPGGKSVEREFRGHPSTVSAQIEMKGWKKVER